MLESPDLTKKYKPSNSMLWEPRVMQNSLASVGVRDPEGKYHSFKRGEQFILIREKEGEDRKPYIRLSDGNQITFEAWESIRTEKNRETFEKSDPDYGKTYMFLIDEYPELKQLDVVSGTKEKYPRLENSPGFCRYPDNASDPNPSIIVAMDKTDDFYRQAMVDREASVRRFAECLDISFEEIQQNPKVLKIFIFLHEIGHAHDYINNYVNDPQFEGDFSKMKEAKTIAAQKELSEVMPAPGYNTTQLRKMHQSGALQEYYKKYEEYYKSGHYKGIAINSPEELITEQEKAYRERPSEKYADDFAASFLKKNWDKLIAENEDVIGNDKKSEQADPGSLKELDRDLLKRMTKETEISGQPKLYGKHFDLDDEERKQLLVVAQIIKDFLGKNKDEPLTQEGLRLADGLQKEALISNEVLKGRSVSHLNQILRESSAFFKKTNLI